MSALPPVSIDRSIPDPPETTAGELADQIESLRAELSGLVQELDRRRHEVLDVRLQLRRHAGAVTFGVTLVAAIAAGRVALRRRRNRRPESHVLGVVAKLVAAVILRQSYRSYR